MPVLLPTKPSVPAASLADYRVWLLYGRPKTGKSTGAATFPKPVFLDIEKGLSSLPVYRIGITSFKELTEAVNALATEKHDFQTVVIDSATALWELMSAELLLETRATILRKVGGGFGEGRDIIATRFKQLYQDVVFKLAEGKRMNIVWTAHSVGDTVYRPGQENPETVEYPYAGRDNRKELAGHLHNSADVVIYTQRSLDKDGNEIFIWRTAPGNICVAGGRAPFSGRPCANPSYAKLASDLQFPKTEEKKA